MIKPTKKISEMMRRIKGSNTLIEKRMESILESLKLKYKKQPELFGHPDFRICGTKILIFCDSSFWHGRTRSKFKRNADFWENKITENRRRDSQVNRQLRKEGWKVLRFWDDAIELRPERVGVAISSELKSNRLNVIDLFCGAGGLSQGFLKHGFNVLLGIDIDKDAVETFRRNHKDAVALCNDLADVDIDEIKRLCGNRKIDIIVGGPPCQGFSMAGRRIPTDPRNSLFREYIRIVKGVNPRACVMENVRGLLSMKTPEGERVIDVILAEFSNAGYIPLVRSINTADYGIPQRRHRIFIIAIKEGIKFDFPEPTYSEKGLAKDGGRLKVWNGIRGILLPPEKVNRDYYYSKKLIKGFRRRERTNKLRGFGFGWSFLNPDKPSYTISARYYKDGAEALVKYSDDNIRMLTEGECAGIQTFPRTYKFFGSSRSTYRQIGNAVPPKMAGVIAREVSAALGDYHD